MANDTWTEEFIQTTIKFRRRQLPVLRSAPADCNGCGACCVFYEVIDVYSEDANFDWLKANGYLNDVATAKFQGMKQVGKSNRCMALVGEIGVDAKCSIYERRPEGCREYKVGAARCRNAIIMEFHVERGCKL